MLQCGCSAAEQVTSGTSRAGGRNGQFVKPPGNEEQQEEEQQEEEEENEVAEEAKDEERKGI